MSDLNSAAFACMNGISEGEPDSSSPSKNSVRFGGSAPFTSFHARQASTNVINWPLSSLAPRARISLPLGPS